MVKNPLWGVLLLTSSSILIGEVWFHIPELSVEDPLTIFVLTNIVISWIAGFRMLTSTKGE